MAFAAVGAPFSYIAASLDLPLRDNWFDTADRALGLDWTSLLNWMDAHASLHPLFSIIYLSLLPQTVIVVLALALAGRLAWLRVFVLAFMISAIVTIVIAALVPAQGVWGFYKLSPAAYPDIVPARLRAPGRSRDPSGVAGSETSPPFDQQDAVVLRRSSRASVSSSRGVSMR